MIARTPYCTKIRYSITGAPILTEDEMDGTFAPGVGVEPTLIELVYVDSREEQPARIDASVTGWWTRFGERDQPEQQVATHFKNGPDGWPAWLAQEARLHDPHAETERLRAQLDEMTHCRDNALRALYRDDVETDIDLEETIAAPFYGPGWDWDEHDLQPVVKEAADAVRPAFGKLTQQRDEARARVTELEAEVEQLTEASRRLLNQRQEMAEERFAWQERGDRAETRVRELEAERAKYVGAEPTIAEEMAHLSRCFFAVHQVCDEAEQQATRWENPLPVPEWVAVVRAAASGERDITPTAFPWAHAMDDGDLRNFLDDLVSAAMGRWRQGPDLPRDVLADIEKACADWREPGKGLRSDEPGTGEGR